MYVLKTSKSGWPALNTFHFPLYSSLSSTLQAILLFYEYNVHAVFSYIRSRHMLLLLRNSRELSLIDIFSQSPTSKLLPTQFNFTLRENCSRTLLLWWWLVRFADCWSRREFIIKGFLNLCTVSDSNRTIFAKYKWIALTKCWQVPILIKLAKTLIENYHTLHLKFSRR